MTTIDEMRERLSKKRESPDEERKTDKVEPPPLGPIRIRPSVKLPLIMATTDHEADAIKAFAQNSMLYLRDIRVDYGDANRPRRLDLALMPVEGGEISSIIDIHDGEDLTEKVLAGLRERLKKAAVVSRTIDIYKVINLLDDHAFEYDIELKD